MPRALLFGTPVSPGIAIGELRFKHNTRLIEHRRISPREIVKEQSMLRDAASSVREALHEAMNKVPDDMAEYREVIAAQIELARDPKLLDKADKAIEKELICASWALENTVEELCDIFRRMDNPYLRDRAQDIRAVGLRLRACLAGTENEEMEAAILAAEDLSPADVMEMDFKGIQAVVTAEGGPTSHTAILSRGLHIPALVGVTGLLNTALHGDRVIVDGLKGCILLDPDEKDVKQYESRRAEYRAWENRTRKEARWPAEMADGVRAAVQANLERPEEVDDLAAAGADGIGLYRTEFSFLCENLPDEEALFAEYLGVARKIAPERVVFRTLDCGADKMLPAQEALREPNPALGLRGIRFCLRHQGIFRTQLRALMRAGITGNIAIMLPMISGREEILAVRRIMQELHQQLQAEGLPHADRLPLGIMVETPSAVLIADTLARECDFFSIGTNDLIHYLIAIDRNNAHVAHLAEALHPAVVRSLKRVIDAAHREGIGVSVCGELAADPYGLAILLGMGVDSVSASPRFISGMKHMIRRLDARFCDELAHSVLMSTDVSVSQRILRERLQAVLGPELSFHTTSILTESRP